MEAAAGGERGRSWYLSKEDIERGSPSRRDGVGAAKEAELRATYCSFVRDVGVRLQLPQITIATAIVLCHRFYLHQSHAKNEWQTVATVCIFLASKIEDTPCPLQHVVIVAHETMYRKDPDAARRIYQKELLEKRKALILVGEALLLSTIRFDFNIQHPYEPLKLALKNLGISQKEVKQVAVNLINDTLRTTLVVQFKPHYIAAGSLSLAAKCHNVRLPSEKGKVWWHQFDVAPKQLEAVIQQMKELFMKRNPCPMGPAIRPIPAPTLVEKQQIVSFPEPVLKYTYSSRRGLSRPTPALIPIPTPVEKQQIISTVGPVLRHAYSSRGGLSRPTTAPTVTPTPPTPMKKQQIISTPDSVLRHTRPSVGGVRRPTPAPAPRPTTAPAKKQQIISTPDSVLRHTHPSVGGVRRPTPAPAPAPTPVKKQQIISTPDSVLRHTHPSRRGLTSNNFDRDASKCMRVDSSVHHNSIGSSARNEDNKPLWMHVDHSLNRTAKDGRSKKLSSRAALKADHVYHVCSGPKDINMTRVTNLVREKRRIQEAGEHPAPVDKSDRDAWTGRQIRSVIVVEAKPSSWKKQKI